MPLLFFALASASSEQNSHEPFSSLALHHGSNGWQSARCCTYPQELLLELERGAEIHEVEISVRGDLVPRSVEVHLSKDEPNGDVSFQHACTLEMQPAQSSKTKKAKQKMFALCSGQVKLLVHEPLVAGPSNPYKQVSLACVDLWGHEDAIPRKPKRNVLDLGEQNDEISAVLMELGVPLSLIPVDEDSSHLATSDLGTKALVKELRAKEDDLLKAQKFGEAQQLEEHVQQLYGIGQELYELLRGKDDALRQRPRNLVEIERLSHRVAELEEQRLHLAALYETDWWLQAMSLGTKIVEPSAASTPSHQSSTGHSETHRLPSQTPFLAPQICEGIDSPKSARNSMPKNFGRTDQTQLAEALSTARSQP
eukprot:Skav203871  [mRNA]  locus=scaffold1031:166511:167611:- [translate_table: standard]